MAEGGFWALGALVVLGSAAVIWFFGRKANAQRVARFQNRANLEPGEFWREFYPEGEVSLQSVEQALRLVSEATEVPPGRLRPEDRFAVELAPERGWEFDDGLAEISWDLEAMKKGSSEGIETVDDLIHRLDDLDHSNARQVLPAQ
jgi:hypothetical protein